MSVRSRRPERADRRASRLGARPFLQGPLQEERCLLPIDVRVQLCAVKRRHQRAMVKLQRDLDQPDDAGGGFRMADVRLDRADGAGTRIHPSRIGTPEPFDLDRVAKWSPRAVSLDVPDRFRRYTGVRKAGREQVRLRHLTGHGEATDGSHMIDGAAFDHCPHVIPIRNRTPERLQHDRSDGFARDVTIAALSEAAATAIARIHLHEAVRGVLSRMQREIHAAGNRDLAVPCPDALNGLMHGHQRRGAHGVDHQARPMKTAEIGDPIGNARGALRERNHRTVCHPLSRDQRVVFVHHPGEHPDTHALVLARRRYQRPRGVTGILDCLPADFQEVALLRVDRLGFSWGDAEEQGIETIHIVEKSAPSRCRLARGRAQPLERAPIPARGRHLGHTVLAGLQILPELPDAARGRKSPCHANDRDVLLRRCRRSHLRCTYSGQLLCVSHIAQTRLLLGVILRELNGVALGQVGRKL